MTKDQSRNGSNNAEREDFYKVCSARGLKCDWQPMILIQWLAQASTFITELMALFKHDSAHQEMDSWRQRFC